MVAGLIVIRNNFQEGFGYYTDQNTPTIKGETNWKALEDSIKMAWTLQGSNERIKTDSAQRSSNKCKKYLPRNYS